MRIIVSAGGTGGHIYPALAIINKFKEHEKDLEVLYIGTHNRMEKDIIPARGIRYESIEIYGFSKSDMKRNFKNIFLINKATKRCVEIMKDFKPDIVMGIGGYVTYPVIKAAKKLNIKTFIHEQNSIAGKTNKSLARQVDLVGVSFKDSASSFPKDKVFYSGNPCAENALTIQKMDKTTLGFNKDKKLVVVVAGSLGSSTINNKMKEVLIKSDGKEYEVLYITGKSLYEDFIKDLDLPKNVKVLPYLDNLSALLKDADLIVTRAGASTMSEVIALKLPAIFIPSPYVANNHQYYNALDLVDKNMSLLIEEKDLDKNTLVEAIDEMFDEETFKKVKENLKQVKDISSSTMIVEEITKRVKGKNEKKGKKKI